MGKQESGTDRTHADLEKSPSHGPRTSDQKKISKPCIGNSCDSGGPRGRTTYVVQHEFARKINVSWPNLFLLASQDGKADFAAE